MTTDLETNPDFLAHVAMCLDLGLDPENPNLEMGVSIDGFTHGKPWLVKWREKEDSKDKIKGYDDGEPPYDKK